MALTTTPAVLYQSDLHTVYKATGWYRPRWPLPKNCPIQQAAYAFDQEFERVIAGLLTPPPKNTPSNAATFPGIVDGNAILTSISQPSPTGGGLGKFSISFARVPASWDDFVTQSVTFPGIRDTTYIGGVRDPLAKTVTIRVRHDYFVVDPAAILTGAGVLDSGGTGIITVSNKGAIPSIYRQPWGFVVSGSVLTTSEVTGLVKSGGITGWLETMPNTGTYQDWVAVVAAFNAALVAGGTQAWDATHPPAWNGTANTTTVGQYCFEDSRLVEYEGNIVDRQSFFVLAQ